MLELSVYLDKVAQRLDYFIRFGAHEGVETQIQEADVSAELNILNEFQHV